jgi:nitrous oxidase accessory protein
MLDAAEIQARIDAASPGAVVVVRGGEYHGNLVVDRGITLRGEGRPLIHGDGTGSVILVSGDGAVIEGFRVANSAVGPVGGPAGIRVEADGVAVQDNVVEDTYMGIAAFGASRLKVLDNVVRGRQGAAIGAEGHAADPEGTDDQGQELEAAAGSEHEHTTLSSTSDHAYRGDGISLWNCEDTIVRDNVVEDARDGIYMSFGTSIILDRNRIANSRYAIHSMYAEDLAVVENVFDANLSGAILMYGGPVLMLRNRIVDSDSGSTGFGLLLKDVFGADVVENVLVGNRVGIQIDGPAGDTEHSILIRRNTVATNRFGVSLYPTAHAVFSGNSFVENAVQVVAQGHGVSGKNTWYDDGLGNYWSDYRGYDLTGEGLGDVPHHEGSVVEGIVVETPVLEALASGPAFGLIRAVEDRWVEHEPIAVDHLPLMSPVSPPYEQEAGGAAGPVLAGAGLAAVALALAVLLAFRTPSRRRRVSLVT